MAIRYTIFRHRLRNHRTGYSARTVAIGTIDSAELANRVAEEHTTVAKSDVLSVIEDYEAKITNLVRDGFNVRTGLACYGTTVEGDFTDESDSYDAVRHRLKPRVTPGRRLRWALRDAQLEKKLVDKPHPQLLTLLDLASGQKNAVLTPGGDARLVGRNLRFDAADPRQGVFFVSADAVETRATHVALNTPALLILRIPELPAGIWFLEVRNVSRDSQELRGGRLDTGLAVGS